VLAPVLYPVPHVLAAVSSILDPVPHVLPPIPDVLTAILNAAVVSRVPAVLGTVTAVLAPVPHILPPVPAIFPPVAHVLDAVAYMGARMRPWGMLRRGGSRAECTEDREGAHCRSERPHTILLKVRDAPGGARARILETAGRSRR